MAERFDVVVVGGGLGGFAAAVVCAQRGRSVLLVEREQIGGVCLNRGCVPTKVFAQSAEYYRLFKSSAFSEIERDRDTLRFDGGKLQEKKRKVVATLRKGMEFLAKKKGVTLLKGEAAVRRSGVEVNGSLYEYDYLVIATGTEEVNLPGLECDGELVQNSTQFLESADFPERYLIVGGGVVGMEFASFLSSIGRKVYVVEVLDSVLAGIHPRATSFLLRFLKRRGVEILTSTKVESLELRGDGVRVRLSGKSDAVLDVDRVVVSVGRKPVLPEGVDGEGYLATDESLRIGERIWAVGDVARPPLLAHKSSHEGVLVGKAICGEDVDTSKRSVPYVVFTDPPIGVAGETVGRSARTFYGISGRAHAYEATEGYLEMWEENGRIRGVVIVGENADSLIGEGALAVSLGVGVEEMCEVVHPHPTLTELFPETAFSLAGLPILNG